MAAAAPDGDAEPAGLGRVPGGARFRNARRTARRWSGTQLLAQGFIRRRSRTRWLAHQLVFWGCILAALVTFPLTSGLLHFQSVGQDADRYQVYLSRVGTISFDAESIVGWLIFHALDIAAVLVLAGVFIFLRRRLRDPGALAVERAVTSSPSPGCSRCRSPGCSSPCRASGWRAGTTRRSTPSTPSP